MTGLRAAVRDARRTLEKRLEASGPSAFALIAVSLDRAVLRSGTGVTVTGSTDDSLRCMSRLLLETSEGRIEDWALGSGVAKADRILGVAFKLTVPFYDDFNTVRGVGSVVHFEWIERDAGDQNMAVIGDIIGRFQRISD